MKIYLLKLSTILVKIMKCGLLGTWVGWAKKNGELLGLTAFNGFDIFIKLDKNLKNQQNLNKVDLKFILLLAKDNKHQTLQPYIDKAKTFLQSGSDITKFVEISLD